MRQVHGNIHKHNETSQPVQGQKAPILLGCLQGTNPHEPNNQDLLLSQCQTRLRTRERRPSAAVCTPRKGCCECTSANQVTGVSPKPT
jgi:hypothetical protein